MLTKSALSSGPRSYGINYFEFIGWSLSLGLISGDDPVFLEQLKDWVYEYAKELEEFIPISNIVSTVDLPPSELTAKLKEQYIEYLSDEITGDVIEVGIMSSVFSTDTCDYSEIDDYITGRFSELGIRFDDADVNLVREYCDISQIVQSNIDSSMHDDQQYESYSEQRYSSDSTVDIINDLFERS